MRIPAAGLLGLSSAILLGIGYTMTSAGAEGGWKSLVADNGDPIHWHSCTVKYAVDLDGAPESADDELATAISDTEAASGVDFQEVPWAQADLKIVRGPRDRGSRLAVTERNVIGDEQVSAIIRVFPNAFGYPKDIRVDNYRHELGHVLGLDHIEGSDTMSPKVTAHPTQTGWRAGLDYLYQDC